LLTTQQEAVALAVLIVMKVVHQKIHVQPQRRHCSVALLVCHYGIETKWLVGLAGDPYHLSTGWPVPCKDSLSLHNTQPCFRTFYCNSTRGGGGCKTRCAEHPTSSVQAATSILKLIPSTRVFCHVSTRSVATVQEVVAIDK